MVMTNDVVTLYFEMCKIIYFFIFFCFFNIFQTSSFPENAESDLQKATSEVILLREEESKLRHENLQLKVSFAFVLFYFCYFYLRVFVLFIYGRGKLANRPSNNV